MARPTKQNPERGDARTRLLEAARDVIRQKDFIAATVDDLCKAAGVTKGAYFQHFENKEALGVATADYWTAQSLARHTQAVLQGAFIKAKATGDLEITRESVDHLRRYIELLIDRTSTLKHNHDKRRTP